MANKTYLDKAGLTYFWGKVKSFINNNKGDIIWTNIQDSSSYPSTQIGVSWGDYRYFKIFYYDDYHLSNLRNTTINIGESVNIIVGTSLTRQVSISSSLLYIHSGYYQGSQNNNAIIPSHIVGYK